MRGMPSPLATALLLPLHAKPDDEIVPLEGWRYLTAWEFPLWAVLPIVGSAALYLWGVHVLHKRGDKWPVGRTLMFVVLGCGTMLVALCSFLGVYDTVLFWLHMVQHMLLNMIAPVFLVSGAPITLALRTLPKKWRSALLTVLHSKVARTLLFPPLTVFLMGMTPVALYMTNWYNITLRDSFSHDFLHAWMTITGCLFFSTLLAVDPVPVRLPYPVRILLFILTMPFHAFLGVTIMGRETLIAEDWYLAFERSWGPSPLRDQEWAGALLWATGDLTMFFAMITIFMQWVRESGREARRMDRAADREEARAAAAGRPVAGTPASRYDEHDDEAGGSAPGARSAKREEPDE